MDLRLRREVLRRRRAPFNALAPVRSDEVTPGLLLTDFVYKASTQTLIWNAASNNRSFAAIVLKAMLRSQIPQDSLGCYAMRYRGW